MLGHIKKQDVRTFETFILLVNVYTTDHRFSSLHFSVFDRFIVSVWTTGEMILLWDRKIYPDITNERHDATDVDAYQSSEMHAEPKSWILFNRSNMDSSAGWCNITLLGNYGQIIIS